MSDRSQPHEYMLALLAGVLGSDQIWLSAEPTEAEAGAGVNLKNPHIPTPSIIFWQSGINTIESAFLGTIILARRFVVSVRAETLAEATDIQDRTKATLAAGQRMQSILTMEDGISEDLEVHERNAEYMIRE